MKGLYFIGGNIIPILLILLAAYMVYADNPYWGWVLVAAILTTSSITFHEKKDEK